MCFWKQILPLLPALLLTSYLPPPNPHSTLQPGWPCQCPVYRPLTASEQSLETLTSIWSPWDFGPCVIPHHPWLSLHAPRWLRSPEHGILCSAITLCSTPTFQDLGLTQSAGAAPLLEGSPLGYCISVSCPSRTRSHTITWNSIVSTFLLYQAGPASQFSPSLPGVPSKVPAPSTGPGIMSWTELLAVAPNKLVSEIEAPS